MMSLNAPFQVRKQSKKDEPAAPVDASQLLREEYLKVRRELELLRRNGRQKMASPGGATGRRVGGRPGPGQALNPTQKKNMKEQQNQRDEARGRVGEQANPPDDTSSSAMNGTRRGGDDKLELRDEQAALQEKDGGLSSREEEPWRAEEAAGKSGQEEARRDRAEVGKGRGPGPIHEYYQQDPGSGEQALPGAERADQDGFRGSFLSRSASGDRRLGRPDASAPAEATRGKNQFKADRRTSWTSSQRSGPQASAAGPSCSHPTPRGSIRQHPSGISARSKRGTAQTHDLYSVAGARAASPSRRQPGRKGSLGGGPPGAVVKSSKASQK